MKDSPKAVKWGTKIKKIILFIFTNIQCGSTLLCFYSESINYLLFLLISVKNCNSVESTVRCCRHTKKCSILSILFEIFEEQLKYSNKIFEHFSTICFHFQKWKIVFHSCSPSQLAHNQL